DHRTLPPALAAWLEGLGSTLVVSETEKDLLGAALRALPGAIVLDARRWTDLLATCARLKNDADSATAPALVVVPDDDADVAAAFQAGEDEVRRENAPAEEVTARLNAMCRRVERDRHIQPTTFLPGPPMIEREIGKRLAAGEQFAVCYADLDHFKEYNDRYSFAEGDRVIRMVGRILHDVV